MSASNPLRYKRPEHSEIRHKNMKFLITDRPTDTTVERYIEDLNKYGANVVVRVCDPSYSTDKLEQKGIKVVVCHSHSFFFLSIYYVLDFG